MGFIHVNCEHNGILHVELKNVSNAELLTVAEYLTTKACEELPPCMLLDVLDTFKLSVMKSKLN